MGGRVIFISSESALNTPKEMVHYGMTKTAQLAVSSGRAESCAGTGVYGERDPSVTQLASHQSFETFKKEFFKTVRPSSLIKRFETTDEVARLVTFVCSPVASGITGAALRVDGGAVPHVSNHERGKPKNGSQTIYHLNHRGHRWPRHQRILPKLAQGKETMDTPTQSDGLRHL